MTNRQTGPAHASGLPGDDPPAAGRGPDAQGDATRTEALPTLGGCQPGQRGRRTPDKHPGGYRYALSTTERKEGEEEEGEEGLRQVCDPTRVCNP